MTTYTPTVWANGDLITDTKLNKIENRIEEIQADNNIIYLQSPIRDDKNFLYFPNAPSWNDIINYQDRGVPIVIQLDNYTRVETKILLSRNAYSTACVNAYLNDYGCCEEISSYSGNNPLSQNLPKWYYSNAIYIALGVTLTLGYYGENDNTWTISGRMQLFYKTNNSHELYISWVNSYSSWLHFNMPYDNGGSGDINEPGDGSCGCGSSGGGCDDRGATRGVVDENDYCNGGSSSPKKVSSSGSSGGDYSGGHCGETYNSIKNTKGSSSDSGDYCNGGTPSAKSGDYNCGQQII